MPMNAHASLVLQLYGRVLIRVHTRILQMHRLRAEPTAPQLSCSTLQQECIYVEEGSVDRGGVIFCGKFISRKWRSAHR
jgi:hypothetical protein